MIKTNYFRSPRRFLLSLFIYLVALSVIVAFLIPNIKVEAANNTYYVAKGGSDSNPGTESLPWLTINRASKTLVAGDTVYVKNGTYSETSLNTINGGTSGKPITYSANPGDSVTIKPADDYQAFAITQPYITLIGFELQNPTSTKNVDAIYVSGSNATLRNLKIHNVKGCGIAIHDTSAHDAIIDNCELYNCNIAGGDETISIFGSSNIEIKNCYIHDTLKAAIDCKEGCANVSIHNNEIAGNIPDVGIYIDAGYASQDTASIQIYNNKIHDLPCPAIVLNSETSPHYNIYNVDIFNNLIYNNRAGFVVWANPFTRTFRVINNTFYHNGVDIAIYGSSVNKGSNVNCIIRNNIIVAASGSECFFNYVDTSAGVIAIDHNLYYDPTGYYNMTPAYTGVGYIKANPLFFNPPTDFNLQSGSPAIDAGSASNAPVTDYIGKGRISGSSVDVGAYEYQFLDFNPSFETDANADGIPDNWSVDKTYIRQSADYASDGSKSLMFNMTAADTEHRRAYSSLIPVSAGKTYSVSAATYYSSLTNAGSALIITSYYTTADGSGTQYISILGSAPATKGVWKTNTFTWTPPSNAKSFKILLYVSNTAVATLYWDNVKVAANLPNTAPVAVNDACEASQDTTLNVTATGVLSNDTDAEHDTLTAVLVSGTSHGTLTLNAAGSFSYTPSLNYSGTDNFTYKANDGKTDSNVATVSLTVKAASFSGNLSFETDANADGIPDNWSVDKTYIRQSANYVYDGSKSLMFNMTAADTEHRRAYSSLIPVSAGKTYSVSAATYYSSLTNAGSALIIASYYTTTDGSGTQYLSILGSAPATKGAWKTNAFTWTPPSNAKSFKILLYVSNTAVATLYWDNVRVN